MVDRVDSIQTLPGLVLPSQAGTYLLFYRLAKKRSVSIGRLGSIVFNPGFYGYVGSAFGPGGLAARLGRHLRLTPRRHWHIDYLKPYLRSVSIWFSTEPIPLEHIWAAALLADPDLCLPIMRFGCSDCTCCSHLFHFKAMPDRQILHDGHAVEKIEIAS
jgi:Uri superfamily endonuclease